LSRNEFLCGLELLALLVKVSQITPGMVKSVDLALDNTFDTFQPVL
jgi:hypothetical protein